jgi:hypothetical protein
LYVFGGVPLKIASLGKTTFKIGFSYWTTVEISGEKCLMAVKMIGSPWTISISESSSASNNFEIFVTEIGPLGCRRAQKANAR